MTAELFTLPLRLGMRAAGLFVRTAEDAAGRAVAIAGGVVHAVGHRSSNGAYAPPTQPVATEYPAAPVADASDVEVTPVVDVSDVEATPAAVASVESAEEDTPPVAVAGPAHVAEEPELVEELAEPGAEDGAGAQVTVIEPWSGYRRMTAKEVIARLTDATPAELAAVQLYERDHRKRETVLSAVERQLRIQAAAPD